VLRSKLTKLINPEDIIDVTPEMMDD